MTVAVLMCGDGLHRNDRTRLGGSLRVIDGFCRQPESVTELETDVDGLVLVLHPDIITAGGMQPHLRAAGFDPFGVPVLDASDYSGNPVGLGVAVAGAVARASAYPGSTPAHAKPVFPDRFTRRSLFTVPQPDYVAAPAIDREACAAEDGCNLCVAACPRGAYRWADGRIAYDKDGCEPCGVCVTTCPTGAVTNPAASPDALGDQIEALTTASTQPLGIMFRCGRGAVRATPVDWQAVEVPCTGMITASWALAPLLLGAAQVAILPCAAGGCDLGLDARAAKAVGVAKDLLVALGIDDARVTDTPTQIATVPLPALPIDAPLGPQAAARVYAGLRAVAESDAIEVGADAEVGVVSIGPACTMCTMCVRACPTGALVAGYADDGQLAITFDPLRCTACDQCVAVCPEAERGAISVDHRVDFGVLAGGPIELNRSATHTCERCGQPVAPTAMMDRIAGILGDDPALMTHLTRLCLACRGAS